MMNRLNGVARTIPRNMFVRGIKFNSKDYAPSQGFSKYSEDLENAIAAQIADIPDPTKAYQNSDGTPRQITDGELQKAAQLAALADVPRATLFDRFKLTLPQNQVLNQNSAKLTEYFLNGRRILDKIPVEDPATGEITWTIVRENQKEGWENIMYYGYVPGLFIALGFYYFLNKETINDWALEELRLRAQEKFGDKPSGSKKEQDDLIVERILSGDYDKLAGVRKAGADIPATLL